MGCIVEIILCAGCGKNIMCWLWKKYYGLHCGSVSTFDLPMQIISVTVQAWGGTTKSGSN